MTGTISACVLRNARFEQTNSFDSNATVYPIIDYDYIVKQPIIGGELSFNSNAMALTNDNGSGTDSDRAIVQMKWRRQMIDGIGEVFTPFAQLRGDIYEVNNFVDLSNGLSENRHSFPRQCCCRRRVQLSVHRHDRQCRTYHRADRSDHRAAQLGRQPET